MKLHTADWTTEGSPQFYAGLPPRTAPPDPMDEDFGITPAQAFWFVVVLGVIMVLGIIVSAKVGAVPS